MKLNFYRDMLHKDEQRKVPDQVIKELNLNLPKGYTYKLDKKLNQLIIVPVNDDIPKKMHIKLNLKEMDLPAHLKANQLFDYLYRTQRSVEVSEGSIADDEKTLDFTDIMKDPITGKKPKGLLKFVIAPEPFPEPQPITISTVDGRKIVLKMKRVPFDSLDSIKIVNDNFPALSLRLIIPEGIKDQNNSLTLTVSVIPARAESIDDALTALSIFEGFVKGSLRIDDVQIGNGQGQEIKYDIKKFEEKKDFYQSIKQIEEILGIKFNPGADYPLEDAKFAWELDKTLVRNEEIVSNAPISHFHVGGAGVTEEDFIKKVESGNYISFTYIQQSKCTLLGAEFELYETILLAHVQVEKVVVDKDRKGSEIYISNIKEDPWKLVRKFSKTMKKAVKIQTELFNKYSEKPSKDNNSGKIM